jgi:hypothetical protein
MIPSPVIPRLRNFVLSLVTFPADAVLFCFEQVHGNGIGVRHLDELDAFCVESSQALLGAQS